MRNAPIFFLIVGFIIFVAAFIFIPIAIRGNQERGRNEHKAIPGTPVPKETASTRPPGATVDFIPARGRRQPLIDHRAVTGGTIETNFTMPDWIWETLIVGGLLFALIFVALSLRGTNLLLLGAVALSLVASAGAAIKSSFKKARAKRGRKAKSPPRSDSARMPRPPDDDEGGTLS